ncbi:MAG: hypothetical protein K6B41_03660 [Butyrivibrio sp.]|nr:hypothetical protein [Butyrivibrio sp.]
MNVILKLQVLEHLRNSSVQHDYVNALRKMHDLKPGYMDYMTTEPLIPEIELTRLEDADYDLCCALMTMLAYEDGIDFGKHCLSGDVTRIVDRMMGLLQYERATA